MGIYSYSKPSIIDEVQFQKAATGSARAYMHAAPGVDGKVLCEIADSMAKKGWQCIPCGYNGKPMLEVRNFGRDSQLITHLVKNGAVVGIPNIKEDDTHKRSFTEKVKNRSLLASGMVYLLGDIGFFSYGYKEASKLDMTAAVAYALGTLSTLTFARKDQSDLQIKDISKQMAAYMRTQKMDVPENCSISSLNDQPLPTIKKADEYLRHYPSEMFNIFTAMAGVCIAIAAYKTKAIGKPNAKAVEELMGKLRGAGNVLGHDALHSQAYAAVLKNMRKEGWADVGLGVLTAASCTYGALAEEKAHDPDAPEKHGVEAMKQWMQEHPLSITGGGLMVSTLCHAWSTAVAWKSGDSERRKAVPGRALFIATNILAEILLAISSKGHGEGVVSDYSVDKSVISLAADLIAQQPKRLQPVLTQHVANFLGQPNVLALKDINVQKELTEQVGMMRDNPWVQAQIEANKNAPHPKEEAHAVAAAPVAAGVATQVPVDAPSVAEPEASTKEGKSKTWRDHVVQQQNIAAKPVIH